MTDLIILAILIPTIVAAAVYLIRAKKRGAHCGCCSCSSKCSGCALGKSSDSTEE